MQTRETKVALDGSITVRKTSARAGWRVDRFDNQRCNAAALRTDGAVFAYTREYLRLMSLGQQLAPHLPFLRRYARALTGSQNQGDKYVRATLEAIVGAPDQFPSDVDPRLGLYRMFQGIWTSANIDGAEMTSASDIDGVEAVARARLARMAPLSRQALLLTAMEGFTPEDAAYLIEVDTVEIETLVADALAEIDKQTRARVMIIEDEPIIAMDIEAIVRDLGHEVTGVAVTRDEAVALAMEDRPGLVLADIQLADDSSGIDAVKDILAEFDVPVIFITAFPERLLTGARPEPTFLITKPFQRSTVKAAISQALFFDQSTVPAES
jgi:DNA-directed RNA polymerase specialized sigma24 family protein